MAPKRSRKRQTALIYLHVTARKQLMSWFKCRTSMNFISWSQHCWPNICKLKPNDRNVSAQHVARVWPPCGDVLRHIGYWKSNKCSCPVATLLHDSIQHHATSTNVAWKNMTIFNESPGKMMLRSNVADRLAEACKCWTNNVAICGVEMLRSFGRGFKFCTNNTQHFATQE